MSDIGQSVMPSVKEKAVGSAGQVKFQVLEKSLSQSFLKDFPSYSKGVVRGQPGGLILLPEYAQHAEELRNFEPKKDDVWIVTYPKCGTTWTQELVWMIMNNCDEEAGKLPLYARSPFLELPFLGSMLQGSSEPDMNQLISLEMIGKTPSPRVIKSHLPLYLLHPKLLDTCKVIYVVRNPKDVIVSYLYHHRLIKIHTFTGDLETFAQYFMDDELFYSPFFPHVLEAWAQRNHPSMLFMFYEDMKYNLRGQIERVAAFLGKKLSGEQLVRLTAHLQFENFAKNESVNFEAGKKMGFMNQEGHFIRKGEIGDWKNHFSPELNRSIDEWIVKNLAGTDLKFITELDDTSTST